MASTGHFVFCVSMKTLVLSCLILFLVIRMLGTKTAQIEFHESMRTIWQWYLSFRCAALTISPRAVVEYVPLVWFFVTSNRAHKKNTVESTGFVSSIVRLLELMSCRGHTSKSLFQVPHSATAQGVFVWKS